VQRTGGVAGTVTMRAEADTDQLPEQEAAELMALADKVRAASHAPRPAGAGPKYDQMEYSFTIEREGRREQVTLKEIQLTPEIRAVADRLILEEARRRKGR
jgi:hypothetical protein